MNEEYTNVLDTPIDVLFPSPWLKAGDLNGDTVLTIQRVNVEPVGMNKDEKLVLYFNEVEKSLIMNKTNSTTVKGLYGAIPRNWIGKKITLFPTDVSFRGEMVEAVRIRPRVPAVDVTPPEPETFPDFA